MTRIYLFLIALAVAAGLAGCGGRERKLASAPEQAAGRAVLRIAWPERSRLMPVAANSIKIDFKRGTAYLRSQVVHRPTGGGTSTVTIGNLPLGDLTIIANAYPLDPVTNPTAKALATGLVTITVLPDVTTNFALSMGSTITRVEVKPDSPTIKPGQSVQLTATAYDADGAMLLLTPATLRWSARNSTGSTAATDVVKVDDDGWVTGNTEGKADVTVVETESNHRATVTVTVTNAPPVTVTISPTTTTLAPRETFAFAAMVSGVENKAITWSVQEGTAGGTIIADGVYTAPDASGSYHVVATSQADPSKKAIAIVNVTVLLVIAPPTTTLAPGQRQTFTVTVLGSNDKKVDWRIQEGSSGGTFEYAVDPVTKVADPNLPWCDYIAPATPGRYHIVVASHADPFVTAVATVLVGGTTSYAYTGSFGGQGTGNGRFSFPWGIASHGNRLYVTDSGNHRVQQFTASGVFTQAWGGRGSGNGQFVNPTGIAVSPVNGDVYVADPWNNRIQCFNADGSYLASFSIPGDNGGFLPDFLRGITVDPSGAVYVVDAWACRVLKFTARGTLIKSWGIKGTGRGQFNSPSAIVADRYGNLFVADSLNHRIQKFNGDGAFICQWGALGSSTGELQEPRGICVDGQGDVYVADTSNNRIVKFTSSGDFLTQWGGYGSGNGQLDHPTGLAADDSGTVYVVDAGNHRVLLFRPAP